MSVTFMTNEDKTVLEQNISKLSEEIDNLFCEIGEYFKFDLLSRVNRCQGSINMDFTIDGTRMDRVVFKIPLDKNKSYYFMNGSLLTVDVCVLNASNENTNTFTRVGKCVYFHSVDIDRTLMVSIKKEDNSELLVSDKLLDDCHLYEAVQKANIDISSLLRQGYYSFSQKTYVDSDIRVCLQCEIDSDKFYRVIAPDDVVLREIVVYNDEDNFRTVFSLQTHKEIVIVPSLYESRNKMQIILARTNDDDALTLSDCANLIFEEVY